ncbi:related to small nuclear ribonucleoprotein sm d3 [Pseudozyma flocculosa]|uniref:Small nuclear ribonucleoprotein Sm D3 n=1 Tax=Pseudozyma flocculosa TaxID=84751 RepID=A0A5C3EZ83_9BASI|nr:related to small nuclear ribonucleoprotein sm d3 [Pseudozyma flocculosa]
MGTIGIPVKLIHEAVGHIITVELKGGASYRGTLYDAEDNFNVSMKDITVTAKDGKQSHLENVYIRGNMIRFVIVPDMLQQAPMFKRVGPNAMKGRGIGSARGRATIMRGEWRARPAPKQEGDAEASDHKASGDDPGLVLRLPHIRPTSSLQVYPCHRQQLLT